MKIKKKEAKEVIKTVKVTMPVSYGAKIMMVMIINNIDNNI